MGQDNGLGNHAHGFARIHGKLLDASERFRFAHAFLVHQQPLGPIHSLARFQSAAQILGFLLDRPELPDTL